MFWSLIPRQVQLHFKAANARIKREHRERAWTVWHIASLGRIKSMPTLDELCGDAKPPPQKQTWQEMRANLRAHLAVIDGGSPQRGAK